MPIGAGTPRPLPSIDPTRPTRGSSTLSSGTRSRAPECLCHPRRLRFAPPRGETMTEPLVEAAIR